MGVRDIIENAYEKADESGWGRPPASWIEANELLYVTLGRDVVLGGD